MFPNQGQVASLCDEISDANQIAIKSIHNEGNRDESVKGGVQVRRRIDDMLCSLLRLAVW